MLLKEMLYVVTISDENSFSKAAQTLYISQPSLSQAVKKLENELGMAIFIRANNSISLTAFGEMFVDEAKKIIDMTTKFENNIAIMKTEGKCSIRIGISTFYSHYYIPKIFHEFEALYPGIRIEITELTSLKLEEAVLNGNLDICMVPLPLVNNNLNYKLILDEEIYIAVPREYKINIEIEHLRTGNNGVDLSLFRDMPFVFLREEQRFTHMGKTLCNEAGFTPNVVFETMNWETIDSMIAGGVGVGFVPKILVDNHNTNKPYYYRINLPNKTRPYVAAYTDESKLPPAAKVFINVAQQVLGKL